MCAEAINEIEIFVKNSRYLKLSEKHKLTAYNVYVEIVNNGNAKKVIAELVTLVKLYNPTENRNNIVQVVGNVNFGVSYLKNVCFWLGSCCIDKRIKKEEAINLVDSISSMELVT